MDDVLGWVKLHRKLLDSAVFDNEKLLKVWVWCLLKASHQNIEIMVGNQLVQVQTGQFVFGRKKASDELKISETMVYKYMNLLEKMGMLSIKRNNKFSLVIIEKWGIYQGSATDEGTTEEQQRNNKGTTKEQQRNTNKNEKNNKNDKKLKKVIENQTLYERLLPEYVLSVEVKAKVFEWITYKGEINDSYQEQGMKALLRQIQNNCLKHGDRAVCDLIDECMASGWKGIIFDRLTAKKQERKPGTTQQGYHKQTTAEKLDDFYKMAAEWGQE